MGFLTGKRAVVIGLASNRSIAWGIAQAMRREGAELALSYQTDKLRVRVEEMAAELGSDFTLPLDVADAAQIDAISAGPIRTLAASGVKGIRQMIAHVGATSPLRRNVTIEDVGNAAAFLCSDLAAGITGQVIYVDAGFNIVGMAFPPDADANP